MITLERPPQTVTDKSLNDWLFKIYQILNTLEIPQKTDDTRGDPGSPGRLIFNTDDSNLNVDTGTNWILPDGSTT